MRSLAYYIIPDRKLAGSSTGSTFSLPLLSSGQDLDIALRFLDRIDGELVEVLPYVRSVRATIGNVDARPVSGTWQLKVTADPKQDGVNTTIPLDWNAGQTQFQRALDMLSGRPADMTVRVVPGAWVVERADGLALDLSMVGNLLVPVTFADINGWQENGRWSYEIRLKQAPLAFTSNSDRVDPAQPYIEAVQDGGTSPDGSYFFDEIQRIVVPVDFRGGYIIRNPDSLARTDRLDNKDTQDSLATALTALMGDTVEVKDSETPGVAFLRFRGKSISGTDVPLLVVEVVDTPPGDVTIRLSLRRPELCVALRTAPVLKDLPFELDFDFVAREEMVSDPSAPGSRSKSSGLTVSIARELAWDDLVEVAGTNWASPPKDEQVLRWSADQVAQGVQHYIEPNFGDGSAAALVLPHNLDSTEIAGLVIYRKSTGDALVQGTDYNFKPSGANAVAVTFTAIPAANSLHAVLTMAIPVPAFAGHTHDTAQINRDGVPLNDILDEIGETLATVTATLASTGAGATSSSGPGPTILLPATDKVLFFSGAPFVTTKTTLARGVVDEDAKALFSERRVLDIDALGTPAPYLLPACHDATVTDVTSLPAAAGNAGQVWRNNGSTDLLLQGGGMLIGAPKTIKPGEFFASDGRILFKVRNEAGTKSYYPSSFELELWRVHINDKMHALNRTLDVQFGLVLQLVNATSNAEWVMVIEKGAAPQDTTPAPIGTNLQNIVWSASPLLEARIIISDLAQSHSFGARIKRSLVASVDTLTLDTMLYGIWSGANSLAPSTANFSLRARMVKFDTENDLADSARGWLAYQIISPAGLDPDSGEATGRAKAVIS